MRSDSTETLGEDAINMHRTSRLQQFGRLLERMENYRAEPVTKWLNSATR